MTEQEKREKIIKGLECIISSGNAGMRDDCANCIYPGGGDCLAPALQDALALLKAQEAQEVMKPIWIDGGVKTIGHFECGKCGANIGTNPKSCWFCGRKVKWE